MNPLKAHSGATSALLALLATLFFSPPLSAQQTESAADYFPKTTAIYMHVKSPAELIDKIENHDVVNHVLEMKPVKQLLLSPQGAMAMAGKGLFEAEIGEPVLDALKTNTSNGIWFCADPATEGVMIAFQSKDENKLKRFAGKSLKFISTMAKGKQPFKKMDYRDAVAAKFDDFLIARYKSWFLICNKPELAKATVDAMIDGTKTNLSSQQWFKDALAERKSSDLWVAIDLEGVRKIANDPKVFGGQTDNPGVELIFGGILDVLKNSPIALGNLNINQHINLDISAPFDADWAHESREYFFGKQLNGAAPKALSPKNMIASLTSYRDVGMWWLSKEELYPENVIAQLAQADSQLSTIFSGMDFGEDVLGALEPGVQVVVAENTYDEKYIPDLKLPAFALVGKIKDAQKLQRRLKIAFQSVIGFANINLGMNGQPQLEVETEKIGDAKISSASYYYEEGTEEGLLLFNFGPTMAFKGEHMVLSSKKELAVELAQMVGSDNETDDANTKLKIDGAMLHKILASNKESLIAQNMLEEGNERDEAESAIGILLTAVELFKDMDLTYVVEPKQMKLDLSIRFNDLNKESAK